MSELYGLVPALGVEGGPTLHSLWPLLLAIVVVALVMPLAYLMGRGGGRADSTKPPHASPQ
jgi:hypothetical protein